ncbi:MAG: hybrid sensor histidine kinase/response regulator [Bacteroidales bacterium]|jgi:signal transduction histidine kinase|nr:hybrid sensor histidine kinase/response regulator [Bacteroidales bacterium]
METDKNNDLENQSVKAQMCYRAIVNALSPNFIFVFNPNFVIKEVILPEGLNLFHDTQSLIDMDAHNFYSKEVSEFLIANIKACLSTGKLRKVEYHLDLFGTRYYYQARMIHYRDDLVLSYIEDISDRIRRLDNLIHQKKKAEEANKIKEAFIRNMSHEFRTPLNSIFGFSELLYNETDQEAKDEYMKMIRDNTSLLEQIVNDVLELSNIDAGTNELNYQYINLNLLLNSLVEKYRNETKEGVIIKMEAPSPDVFASVATNALEQIMDNLITNSIKHTFEGSITIRLEIKDDKLYFYVSDTGSGIPQDKFKTIFNRFEKLDNFMQGTGLGLSICEKLIANMQGEIFVDSVVGQGSCFSFYIPYYSNVEKGNIQLEKNIENTGDELKKKDILVIVRSEENYNIIKNILGDAFNVVWGHNCNDAYDIFINQQPVLMLLSVKMAQENGGDLIKNVKSIYSNFPIIGITSEDFYGEQKWAIEHGCDDFLEGAFSGTKLKEIVLSYI